MFLFFLTLIAADTTLSPGRQWQRLRHNLPYNTSFEAFSWAVCSYAKCAEEEATKLSQQQSIDPQKRQDVYRYATYLQQALNHPGAGASTRQNFHVLYLLAQGNSDPEIKEMRLTELDLIKRYDDFVKQLQQKKYNT